MSHCHKLLKNPYGALYGAKPGCQVKLRFEDEMSFEPLWIKVVAYDVRNGIFAGRLIASPFFVNLSKGQGIIFRAEHIFQVW